MVALPHHDRPVTFGTFSTGPSGTDGPDSLLTMAERVAEILPLQLVLEELDAWQADPSPARRNDIAAALQRMATNYGARGVYVRVSATPMRELEVGAGSLAGIRPPAAADSPGPDAAAGWARLQLASVDGDELFGNVWLDGEPAARRAAARAITIAFDAAWSRAEARAAGRRIEALDEAVRGVAGVLSVERVLQSIVDNVRALSDAEYAALGIVGPAGVIDAFITSGISEEQRAAIGHLPRGLGLLGLIIREGRSFRIDDVATDPRRYGFPAHHPEMHAFLGVPVRSKEGVLGNLYLTNKRTAVSFSEADQKLVEMFALHAGIAIENARLHEKLQRLAVVDERHRISQDLHDSTIQSLYAIGLALEDLPEIFSAAPDEGAARVDRSIEAIHSTIRDIRNFILGLRPELLEQAELASGLHVLANEFQVNTMIDVEVRVPERLPPMPSDTADHLLSMTREALSNIARHSGATRASIELAVGDDALRLLIGDNGRGFDRRRARTSRQHGLTNLQQRARALGGVLVIHSEEGAGTQLEALVPLGGNGQTAQPGDEDGN